MTIFFTKLCDRNHANGTSKIYARGVYVDRGDFVSYKVNLIFSDGKIWQNWDTYSKSLRKDILSQTIKTLKDHSITLDTACQFSATLTYIDEKERERRGVEEFEGLANPVNAALSIEDFAMAGAYDSDLREPHYTPADAKKRK